jgi:hypothetical protein
MVLLLSSCGVPTYLIPSGFSPPRAPVQNELVLKEGARLEAGNLNSKITVIAGKNQDRRYEWGGCGIDSIMGLRLERWYGSLGMYDAAYHPFNGNHTECNGITRPVVEEGQIHFADLESAETWIARYSYFLADNKVWTNDGLLIRWAINPQRSQIGVDLWQICIRGERPTKLKGASDQSIKISHPNGSAFARQDCAHVPESVYEETKKIWDDHWRKINESILIGSWRTNSERIEFMVGNGTYYYHDIPCYKFSYTLTGDVLTNVVLTETPELPNLCGFNTERDFYVSLDGDTLTMKLIGTPNGDCIPMLPMICHQYETTWERIPWKH